MVALNKDDKKERLKKFLDLFKELEEDDKIKQRINLMSIRAVQSNKEPEIISRLKKLRELF